MEGSENHVLKMSCALCESRRGVSLNCCCPDNEKEFVVITEEKLRRRAGINIHDRLCPMHAKKLKNGFIFGESSLYECCAPFHVKTIKSPGLRSLPHSWKPYFSSPTSENGNRYRPRQRICQECYVVALEVINSDNYISSDDDDNGAASILSSSSLDFGYISPRRWASNFSLVSNSSHGSQYGSSWSLSPNTSPMSPSSAASKHLENTPSSTGILRRRALLARVKLPESPDAENKKVDAFVQPSSPDDVFATTTHENKNRAKQNEPKNCSNMMNESSEFEYKDPEPDADTDDVSRSPEKYSDLEDPPSDTPNISSRKQKGKEDSHGDDEGERKDDKRNHRITKPEASDGLSQSDKDSSDNLQVDHDQSHIPSKLTTINMSSNTPTDLGIERVSDAEDKPDKIVKFIPKCNPNRLDFSQDTLSANNESQVDALSIQCETAGRSKYQVPHNSEEQISDSSHSSSQRHNVESKCDLSPVESRLPQEGTQDQSSTVNFARTEKSDIDGLRFDDSSKQLNVTAKPNHQLDSFIKEALASQPSLGETDINVSNDSACQSDRTDDFISSSDRAPNGTTTNLSIHDHSDAIPTLPGQIPIERFENDSPNGTLMNDPQSKNEHNGRECDDGVLDFTPNELLLETSPAPEAADQEPSDFRFDPITKWGTDDENDDGEDSEISDDRNPDDLTFGEQNSDNSNDFLEAAALGVNITLKQWPLDEENEDRMFAQSNIVSKKISLVEASSNTDRSRSSSDGEDCDDTPEKETRPSSEDHSKTMFSKSSAFHYQSDSSTTDGDFELHTIEEESKVEKLPNSQSGRNNQHEIGEILPSESAIKVEDSPVQIGLRRRRYNNDARYKTTDDLPSHMERGSSYGKGKVTEDGEIPPHVYMQERRKVRFDDESTPISNKKAKDISSGDQEANISALPAGKGLNEDKITPTSVSKTDLYKQLHGSKDTNENSLDICQDNILKPHETGDQNMSPEDFPPNGTKNDPELRSGISSNEDARAEHLRKRMKNSRSISFDANVEGLQRKSTREPNTILSNRRSVWTDKRRKFGVSFALPTNVILEEIATPTDKGKLIEESVECTSIAREERVPRTAEYEDDEDEEPKNEITEKPITLRESRRVPNKEKRMPQEADNESENRDEKAQTEEDEDVSAALSEIFSSVFTTKTLSEWIKSLNDTSVPLVVIAGLSIAAFASISMLAFLAFVY